MNYNQSFVSRITSTLTQIEHIESVEEVTTDIESLLAKAEELRKMQFSYNAEMTVLIGKEKAELFATAHEDKDVTGNESNGYPKTAHRDMDLHNNEVGRAIGENNSGSSEDEKADIIYQDIYFEETQFIWLHD